MATKAKQTDPQPVTSAAVGAAASSSAVKGMALTPVAGARTETPNDLPTTVDRLGFKPYVEGLAKFLLNPHTVPPLTISIEGEWGSGKSSFMRQLQAEVEKQRATPHVRSRLQTLWASKFRQPIVSNPFGRPDARIFEFSPWRHETDQSLWASFALAFIKHWQPKGFFARIKMGVRLSWRLYDKGTRRLYAALFAIASMFLLFAIVSISKNLFFPDPFAKVKLSGIELWFAYVIRWWPSATHTGLASIATAVACSLFPTRALIARHIISRLQKDIRRPNYKEKVSFIEEFHSDFSEFLNVYTRQNERILVMMEDLDRCDPSKAAELLKAINLLIPDAPTTEEGDTTRLQSSGSARLIFVIAIDRAKVAAGLAASNEKLARYISDSSLSPSQDPSTSEVLAYWYEYLEKFVQLPFRLPRVDEIAVQNYVRYLVNAAKDLAAPPSVDHAHQIEETKDLIDADGQLVEKIVNEMAPYFGYNPRRIKQFLGLFRLRFYVLYREKQFEEKFDLAYELPQLGRCVTLELGWPRLIDKLGEDSRLIVDLIRDTRDQKKMRDSDPRLVPWKTEQRLLKLLMSFGNSPGIASAYVSWAIGVTRQRPSSEDKNNASEAATTGSQSSN